MLSPQSRALIAKARRMLDELRTEQETSQAHISLVNSWMNRDIYSRFIATGHMPLHSMVQMGMGSLSPQYRAAIAQWAATKDTKL